MKFDPITRKKRISSLEQILKGEYLEIPAENGRNPKKQEQEIEK